MSSQQPYGLDGFFKGRNTLYKDEKGLYQLILHQLPFGYFNKICNILSENMVPGRSSTLAAESHYREHCVMITHSCKWLLSDHALLKISYQPNFR
ncbi:MAG: adaptor protein MecA [Blautia sp.]